MIQSKQDEISLHLVSQQDLFINKWPVLSKHPPLVLNVLVVVRQKPGSDFNFASSNSKPHLDWQLYDGLEHLAQSGSVEIEVPPEGWIVDGECLKSTIGVLLDGESLRDKQFYMLKCHLWERSCEVQFNVKHVCYIEVGN